MIRRTSSMLDWPLLVDADGISQWVEFGRHLQAVAELGREVMPGLGGQLDRVWVALRLWSGCLMAVKTIAHETRAGVNAASGRAEGFAAIDALAAEDARFRAGVEAAPAFLAARGQSFCLDGSLRMIVWRLHATAASRPALDEWRALGQRHDPIETRPLKPSLGVRVWTRLSRLRRPAASSGSRRRSDARRGAPGAHRRTGHAASAWLWLSLRVSASPARGNARSPGQS